MATVRDLVNVTKSAIQYYGEVRELEILLGAQALTAERIAKEAATRKAIAELLSLLEADTCDL